VPRSSVNRPLLAFRSRGGSPCSRASNGHWARYFPEIVDAVGELAADAVLDGELVVWNDRHLDFAALQQRIHPRAGVERSGWSLPYRPASWCLICWPAAALTCEPSRIAGVAMRWRSCWTATCQTGWR
jgi:hypothetical protein